MSNIVIQQFFSYDLLYHYMLTFFAKNPNCKLDILIFVDQTIFYI
jgi:hypothetical protein